MQYIPIAIRKKTCRSQKGGLLYAARTAARTDAKQLKSAERRNSCSTGLCDEQPIQYWLWRFRGGHQKCQTLGPDLALGLVPNAALPPISKTPATTVAPGSSPPPSDKSRGKWVSNQTVDVAQELVFHSVVPCLFFFLGGAGISCPTCYSSLPYYTQARIARGQILVTEPSNPVIVTSRASQASLSEMGR